MASLMENLIETLNHECAEYEKLIELSKKKTDIIVKGDVKALEQITEEEQDVIGNINRYDQSREEITKDIATVINKDVEVLKLNNMVQMLEGRGKEQEDLRNVQQRLKKVTKEIQIVNQQNENLIAHSLGLISFEMGLLQSMKKAPETANYTRGAQTSGSLLSRGTGVFDATQ